MTPCDTKNNSNNNSNNNNYYYYHYNHFMALWILSGTIWVSQYQKGKTNLDLLEQEIMSGSGISWAICKSAPHPRHITTPASHHSGFYRPDALPVPKEQRQSIADKFVTRDWN